MACVVDLDRRCSFIANLPHHLRDREIDDSVLDLVRGLAYEAGHQSFFRRRERYTDKEHSTVGILFFRQWSI